MDIIDTSVEIAIRLLLETAKRIDVDCYATITEDCTQIIKHINQYKNPILN